MQVDAFLNRALSVADKGIRYKLGAGGMKPDVLSPAAGGACDCSGYVAWCLGISRQTRDPSYVKWNGGWIETSAVYKDINSSTGMFDPVTQPKPGCVLVFPDKVVAGVHHEGHIGIVVEAKDGVVQHVVHCSLGNMRQFKDAIHVTGPQVFTGQPNLAYGWFVGLT